MELAHQHRIVILSIGNPSKGNIIESKRKKPATLQTKEELRKMTKSKETTT